MKRLTFLACIVALAGPAVSHAEPTWHPSARLTQPADVYTGVGYDRPTVAVNARGDAVIGFSMYIATTPVAEVAWRSAGALGWSGPARLAEGSWTSPQVALDTVGNALAVFDKGIVQTSYHGAGAAAWGDAITIGGYPFDVAAPGLDASGNFTTAWNVWRDPHVVVQAATRTAAGTWQQPPLDVSPATDRIWGPANLAVDARGDALLAWSYTGPDGISNIHTSFRRRGAATWEDPVNVAANWGERYEFPVFVGLDDAGNATVVWSLNYGGGRISAAYRPFGGRWGPVQSVSESGTADGLVVGADGRAVLLYSIGYSGPIFAISRTRAGAPWQAAVQLSDVGREARSPSLASDTQGNVMATWVEESANAEVLRAALRPVASQRWEPAVDVATSPGSYYSSIAVAMDGSGNAVAVWDPYAFQYRRAIDVLELKAGGPILSQLSIPTSGGTGVRTPFSVSPLPWVAPVSGPAKWDFGDGSSATGNRVGHVYTRVGIYEVRVSASAGDGASTETRTITVGKPTLVNATRPVIRGVPRVGRFVRCDRGTWNGTEPIAYSYVWLRNSAAVARGERYRIRRADKGTLLACRVKATNGPKTGVAVSRSVRVRPG